MKNKIIFSFSFAMIMFSCITKNDNLLDANKDEIETIKTDVKDAENSLIMKLSM